MAELDGLALAEEGVGRGDEQIGADRGGRGHQMVGSLGGREWAGIDWA